MTVDKLIIRNLQKSYDKVVLDGINFEFEQGKIYAILGRNGAGKTTLFNCLNSDVSYEQGTFTLVSDFEERELEFSDLGLVSASPVLPEFLTGYEFLHFFMLTHQQYGKASFFIIEYWKGLEYESRNSSIPSSCSRGSIEDMLKTKPSGQRTSKSKYKSTSVFGPKDRAKERKIIVVIGYNQVKWTFHSLHNCFMPTTT